MNISYLRRGSTGREVGEPISVVHDCSCPVGVRRARASSGHEPDVALGVVWEEKKEVGRLHSHVVKDEKNQVFQIRGPKKPRIQASTQWPVWKHKVGMVDSGRPNNRP